jgi:hypothetical protein
MHSFFHFAASVGLHLFTNNPLSLSLFCCFVKVDIPEQDTRLNVRRDEDVRVRSISTGAVPSRTTTGIQLSVHSKRRPRLTRLLVAFARAHIPDQSFCFNAITINDVRATKIECRFWIRQQWRP